MTEKEKNILKKLYEHDEGLLSPADFINGIAQRDRRSVENLVAKGYVETVPQERINSVYKVTYTLDFYRATEKGLMVFAPRHKRLWFSFRNNVAVYVGVVSILLGSLTLIISTTVSWYTIHGSLEANRINEKIAEIEYDNAQPFLIIAGGNEEATDVKIQNAGGGPAKNILFLKHYLNASSTNVFILTKESNVGLALASGQEKGFNLNERFMDHFESKDEITKRFPCVPKNFFLDERKWIAAFYENIRGEKFASKYNGSGGSYNEATEFIKISACQ